MSPREFDGAVAQEVHEHFDADGRFTGTTVVTRESMWDDDSRGRALRLAEHKRSLCSCGCGFPAALTQRDDLVVGVGSYVCAISRAVEIKKRMDNKEHKDDQPDPRTGAKWADGRRYYPVPQT